MTDNGLKDSTYEGQPNTSGGKPEDTVEAVFPVTPEEDEHAFSELQDILVGNERKTIKRLEGAVKGFLTAVVNDEELEELVTSNVNSSINRHINNMKDKISIRLKELTEEAIVREFAVQRGTLPDRVAAPVDTAIKERIKMAEPHIEAVIKPVFDKILREFVESGKTEINEQLYPEVSRVIEEKVKQNLPQVKEYTADTIEAVLAEGMRTSAGQHLTNMIDHVSYQATLRNRRTAFIVAGFSALILVLSLFFMYRQGKSMQGLRIKIQELEKNIHKSSNNSLTSHILK
ncbi:MAG: hypothetical protein ACYTFY_02450 [Planctomycetota bacterium]|jgi:hypothetical protein